MNNQLLVFVFLFSLSIYSQREEVIFLFDNNSDTLVKKNGEEIYTLQSKYSYIFKEKKHIKKEVSFKLKKKKIMDYKDFIRLNNSKKFPDYYNKYSFYILMEEKNNTGCLIEVDKIWLVENKISD